MRSLLLRMAEPPVRPRPGGWLGLLARRAPAAHRTVDNQLTERLLPLIRRMCDDHRHVHDRRRSSDKERHFVVSVMSRHAVAVLQGLEAEEVARIDTALRGRAGVLDVALAQIRRQLREIASKGERGLAGGESALMRCAQHTLSLNCVKEALRLALRAIANSRPPGG
ncbi:hypothetical protein [Roseateles chitosanitabidus]|uniref:hypothetical protein n=1 Tax=Roseateles chitosanitabidus TaxID=65048 RepID=UPI0011DF6BBF|nr:hypothetical protein [Roseateles chitosanitabidus]